MDNDRPLDELAHRARAAANRLLRKHTLAERRELHDRLVGLDTKGLLATAVADARFVALDLETTGFAAYGGDEIVQIAMLEYRGLEPTGREMCSLVKPTIPIPPTSTAVHGIDDEAVADAPPVEALIDEIVDFLDAAVIVGHHVAFDMRFLNRVMQRELFCRLPHPTVDTMLLYLSYSGRLGHYELDEVATACGIPLEGRHDARGDALIAGRILARLAADEAEAGASVSALIAGARPEAHEGPAA